MNGEENLETTVGKENESTPEKTGVVEAVEPPDPRIEESPPDEEYPLRAIYENTPVMMHSIGPQQQIVSVNRNWLEVMGYKESEVIGRKSSEFLTEESRRYAVEVALPRFFKTGSARDVAYQMVKKTEM